MSVIRSIPKPPSLSEVVLDELQRLISEGVFKPGDRLPSEKDLAEQLGVGRSSVREAMRVLQLLGVIEVIQGKGSFVRQTNILPLVVNWARLAQMGPLAEVMEARLFIEVLIAELAAERATDEDIAKLEGILHHSRESLSNLEESAHVGVDFHIALAEATHNQVIALMYRTIYDLFVEMARRTRTSEEAAHSRMQDHERIFQAVLNRDPEEAAQAMREHLESAYKLLMDSDAEPTPAVKDEQKQA